MTNNIKSDYFNWLCHFIRNRTSRQYHKLLSCLFYTDFHWSVENDGNREEDGLDMRGRYEYEENADPIEVRRYLQGTCSILEMMVALALRCEEHIMDEPEVGNRTEYWFWLMIKNLGLTDQIDQYFNEERTEEILHTFLNRGYEPDGKGGLFIIHDDNVNIRDIEIWYQMCYYLDEMLNI